MGDKRFDSYSNEDIESITITDEGDGPQPVQFVDVVVSKFSSSAEVCAALDRVKMAVIQHFSALRSG